MIKKLMLSMSLLLSLSAACFAGPGGGGGFDFYNYLKNPANKALDMNGYSIVTSSDIRGVKQITWWNGTVSTSASTGVDPNQPAVFNSSFTANGAIRFPTGAVNGYVWTADNNGYGSWQVGGGSSSINFPIIYVSSIGSVGSININSSVKNIHLDSLVFSEDYNSFTNGGFETGDLSPWVTNPNYYYAAVIQYGGHTGACCCNDSWYDHGPGSGNFHGSYIEQSFNPVYLSTSSYFWYFINTSPGAWDHINVTYTYEDFTVDVSTYYNPTPGGSWVQGYFYNVNPQKRVNKIRIDTVGYFPQSALIDDVTLIQSYSDVNIAAANPLSKINFTSPVTFSSSTLFNNGLVTSVPGSGTTQAQFGSSIPLYITANWPNIGFNAYFTDNWYYGAGSSQVYAAFEGFNYGSGQIGFWMSTSTGNAGEAIVGENQVLSLNYNGEVDTLNNMLDDGSGNARFDGMVDMSGNSIQNLSSLTPDGTNYMMIKRVEGIPIVITNQSGEVLPAELVAIGLQKQYSTLMHISTATNQTAYLCGVSGDQAGGIVAINYGDKNHYQTKPIIECDRSSTFRGGGSAIMNTGLLQEWKDLDSSFSTTYSGQVWTNTIDSTNTFKVYGDHLIPSSTQGVVNIVNTSSNPAVSAADPTLPCPNLNSQYVGGVAFRKGSNGIPQDGVEGDHFYDLLAHKEYIRTDQGWHEVLFAQ